jgi:histidine ammonia-lyase
LTGPSELRVSDEQRDRAAQELREHFASGRITEDELSDRVQTVYSARTEQELQALLADLPKLPATRQQRKAELAERRRELRLRLLQETEGGLGLFVLCTVI